MKVVKKDGSRERAVLIGMVVHDSVLARIADKWDKKDGFFKTPWANLVAGWCVDYHNNYGKAPRANVEPIYQSWAADKKADPDTVKLVERFLGDLSGEYKNLKKEINPDYVVDLAAKHFNEVRLRRLKDAIEGDLEFGKAEEAFKRIARFDKVEVGTDAHVDVLQDVTANKLAMSEVREPLVKYPGALGEFFGDELERDAFVAFMAPMKRGKCVHEDTEVLLADGRVRKIKDIVAAGEPVDVMSYDEESMRFVRARATQLHDNGLKPCYAVVTRTGRRVVTTDNHLHLTPDGWKELKHLRPGDMVAVPKCVPVFGDQTMDRNVLKFLAYMMAEGCCRATQPSFTNTDEILVADFHAACDGLGVGYRRDGISTFLRGANQLIRDLGLHMKLSKEKTIPASVFSAPKDQVAEFLRIFFSCDGSIYRVGSNRYQIEVGLASERLIDQIMHLLTRFGVVSQKGYGAVKLNAKEFDAWRLIIRDQANVKRFLEEINFLSRKYVDPKTVNVTGRAFIDRMPHQVAERFLSEYTAERVKDKVPRTTGNGPGKYVRPGHAARVAFGPRRLGFLRTAISNRTPVMAKTFGSLIPGSAVAEKYLGSQVLWDEVVSVKEVGVKRTYDLGVPKYHNFVANDYVVHNTFWLMDIAWRGMLQRRRVAFFEVGDLSQAQALRRFNVRAANRPIKPTRPDKPVMYPEELTVEDGVPHTVLVPREYKGYLSDEQAAAARKKVMLEKVKSKESFLRLSVHPTKSITVGGVRAIIDRWIRVENWVPDIVVVDYADILAPFPGYSESRDAVNANWAALRRTSQELHCLVVTCTQTKAASFTADMLDMEHFAEDNRKFAHVTAMYGINQNAKDKEKQVQRLNAIVVRESEFHVSNQVFVAGCLGLANPAVKSSF